MIYIFVYKRGDEGLLTLKSQPGYIQDEALRNTYRRAIDGAEWKHVEKQWVIRVDQAPGVLANLADIPDFKVIVHDLAKPLIAAEEALCESGVQDVEESLREVQHKLAIKGKHLFPYQLESILFMASRTRSFNADQPGLGKTVCSLVALPFGYGTLVVCPSIAKEMWYRETKEWRDDYVPTVIETKKQFRLPAAHELLIVNPELLPVCPKDSLPAPLCFVVDEAHMLKGDSARAAHARTYSARASKAIGLSGTPLPNDPLDLWNILSVFLIEREAFGSKGRFVSLFRGKPTYFFKKNPNAYDDEPIRQFSGYAWGVCPTNTPPKGTPEWETPPTGCEYKRVSEAVDHDLVASLDEDGNLIYGESEYDEDAEPDFPNLPCATCGSTIHQRKPMPPSPEIGQLLRKVMVRHEKKDVLKDLPPKIYKLLGAPLSKKWIKQFNEAMTLQEIDRFRAVEDLDQITKPKDGDDQSFLPGLMEARKILAQAKIEAAEQILNEWEAAGNIKPLVFSAHRAPVEHFGKRLGWESIIGGLTDSVRAESIDKFQSGILRGMAISIAAASVSMTLTEASHELFIDRAWNPSDNDQAEDRAHRIGQTKGLLVFDLIADHPVDRHVHLLIQRKRKIIDATVGLVTRDRDLELPLLRHLQRSKNASSKSG